MDKDVTSRTGQNNRASNLASAKGPAARNLPMSKGIPRMSFPMDCPPPPTTKLPLRIAYQLKSEEMTVKPTEVMMLATR